MKSILQEKNESRLESVASALSQEDWDELSSSIELPEDESKKLPFGLMTVKEGIIDRIYMNTWVLSGYAETLEFSIENGLNECVISSHIQNLNHLISYNLEILEEIKDMKSFNR